MKAEIKNGFQFITIRFKGFDLKYKHYDRYKILKVGFKKLII